FLIEQNNLGNFVNNKPWRKLLEEVPGIGEPTAKKIIALAKGNESPKEPMQTAGEPVTAQLLQNHLKDESFEVPCLTVLKEDMKKAGLRYGQGQHQNILHDSDEIVVYREKYVQCRLDNLGRKGLPIKAEVFLDELYCRLDHHAKRTWYVSGGKVNETGWKPMLVIFGAFVVFSQGDALHAKLVEENIGIWPLKGKSHVDQLEPQTGDKCKCNPGRPPTKNTPRSGRTCQSV
ncbi:hypothetical protein BJV82DRAFT_641546, partial [Fennellomyces sp. T-0311]